MIFADSLSIILLEVNTDSLNSNVVIRLSDTTLGYNKYMMPGMCYTQRCRMKYSCSALVVM